MRGPRALCQRLKAKLARPAKLTQIAFLSAAKAHLLGDCSAWNFVVPFAFFLAYGRNDSVSAREPSQRQPGNRSLQVFVLDVDRRPTLAFEAPDLAQARETCRDADLRADLMALTSNGVPVCETNSALVPRLATQEEISVFQRAVELAPASDQPTMTFLMQIDGFMVVTLDSTQC
jgi:hypothetical protein